MHAPVPEGLSPDVSLYNTLMWVYTQNYHQFSQSHFLKDMNSNGVAPNNVKVSYECVIMHEMEWEL